MPPSGRHSTLYWAPPSAILETSLESRRCSSLRASGPLVWISPMCETSKIPHALRTARCSCLTPSYCTGISQPAKSTIFAPAWTWRSNRGVRRRSDAAGEVIAPG